MSSAREIAAKLSKAQRDGVLEWPGGNPVIWNALRQKGFAKGSFLTPLGLEVRSILQEKQP